MSGNSRKEDLFLKQYFELKMKVVEQPGLRNKDAPCKHTLLKSKSGFGLGSSVGNTCALLKLAS